MNFMVTANQNATIDTQKLWLKTSQMEKKQESIGKRKSQLESKSLK